MKQPFNLLDAALGIITGNPDYATDEVRAERVSICNTCPTRNAATNTCGICHCWIPGKTKFAKSSCPQFKW